MKGWTFAVVTALLVVGAVAMLPQAVSAGVSSIQKTLPTAGTPVTFNLNTGGIGVVIHDIHLDNTSTPTTTGCTQFDYFNPPPPAPAPGIGMRIGPGAGKPFRPGTTTFTIGSGGVNATPPAIRSFFAAFTSASVLTPLFPIPVPPFSKFSITFANSCGGPPNPNTILKVIFGYDGSGTSGAFAN